MAKIYEAGVGELSHITSPEDAKVYGFISARKVSQLLFDYLCNGTYENGGVNIHELARNEVKDLVDQIKFQGISYNSASYYYPESDIIAYIKEASEKGVGFSMSPSVRRALKSNNKNSSDVDVSDCVTLEQLEGALWEKMMNYYKPVEVLDGHIKVFNSLMRRFKREPSNIKCRKGNVVYVEKTTAENFLSYRSEFPSLGSLQTREMEEKTRALREKLLNSKLPPEQKKVIWNKHLKMVKKMKMLASKKI
jgi:hypothetical protein